MAERLSPRLNWTWGIGQGNWEDSGGEWIRERERGMGDGKAVGEEKG